MKRPASGIEAMPVAAWRRADGWSRERDGELVAWFVSTVAPRLHSLRPSDIRRALGCPTWTPAEGKLREPNRLRNSAGS
jgi:hypothetical protein